MVPDKGLSLVSFLLSRVVRVMLEVSAGQQRSVDLVQLRQIGEVSRHGCIRMLIGKYERDVELRYLMERGHEYEYLFIRHARDAPVPRHDVEHHDRKRGEIKGDVVAQRSPRSDSDNAAGALVDQLYIADISMIWIKPPTISRVEAVVENPWQIVPVDDPKDECFARIET